MRRDLIKSGISPKLIARLGLRVLTSEQTEQFMTKGRGDTFGIPSYEIPYFNSAGQRTGYSRLKNLAPTRVFSFGSTTSKKKKTMKYLQRANTAPHLYIPPVIRWPRNEEGKVKVPRLVVTEGEKKAICACVRGIYCVALGGVDSFKSTKRSVSMLAEFTEFDLSETIVEICYDSDTNTNPDVQRASGKLAAELLSLNPAGLNTVYIDGESTDDGKQGLDDYLIQYADEDGIAAFDELKREEDQRFSKMNVLSRDLCYLANAGKLYNIPDDRYYDGAAPLIIDYGPKLRVTDPDNPQKQIPAVKLWLETRTESTYCERTVYEPGKPQRFREEGAKRDSINVWRRADIAPLEGDVTLWLQLVKYIMKTDEYTNWFLQWLAYPIQNPGAKLYSAVFVYSYAQGVGKNFIIEPIIKNIYGKNYQVITTADLESDYNPWAAKRQFIFGEEIWMSDKRDRESTMGKLKSLVSNEEVGVREKYRPLEVFKNKAQYYLTANQPNALALDEKDRRFFVIHAPEKPLPEEFYSQLDEWSRKKSSAGKVLSYLLHKVDCSSFNPHAHALMTDAKSETIEQSRDPAAHWVTELAQDPDKFYSMNGIRTAQEIFSAAEIFQTINVWLKENNHPELRASPNSLARYLNSNPQIPYRRLKIKLPSGIRVTRGLYALFNRDTWKRKTLHEKYWRRHYKAFSMLMKPTKVRAPTAEETAAVNSGGKDDSNVLPFPKKPRAALTE